MSWERLIDAEVWNRLGATPQLSRGAFNYSLGKGRSPNPGAPIPFAPDLKGANPEQQAWARSRSNDPMLAVSDQMANYGWTGANPYGMTALGDVPGGSQWDTGVPLWAQNAYEYGRASSMPSGVSNTAKYGNGTSPQFVPGFTPPPQGWGGLTVQGNHFVFGREGNNSWLADSGIQLPSGDNWDTGSIDYTHPNWWRPDSGAWTFGRLENDNDMGGLGMMLSLGSALAGFGFSPPITSMLGNSGGGTVPVQATMTPPSTPTPALASSPQVAAVAQPRATAPQSLGAALMPSSTTQTPQLTPIAQSPIKSPAPAPAVIPGPSLGKALTQPLPQSSPGGK